MTSAAALDAQLEGIYAQLECVRARRDPTPSSPANAPPRRLPR